MKSKLKSIKLKLGSKQGMTLTEVLVAFTLLVLIIFTFLPLFVQNYRNIRTAGDITKETYNKASLLERLIANKGENAPGYETTVASVPLILSSDADTYVTFGVSSTDVGAVNGTIISNNIGSANSYSTFYTSTQTSRMVCFPSTLNDDFLTKDITVVPKGFVFNDAAERKSAPVAGWHFEVYYTDSTGGLQKVGTQYYDIKFEADGDGNVAVFTFKGANSIISFQNSPIVIKYGAGSEMAYSVEVEIGAPEIILVGEKTEQTGTGTGEYFYYATSGVNTETGEMDLIAKKMTGTAELNSAMNDVQWVEKGMGDDGNGGVNQYGYYVMGGDAGQVRRFWRNETTGNYYWGGDNLVDYYRYAYFHDWTNTDSTSKEIMTPKLTTQASYISLFRSDSATMMANRLVNSGKTALFGIDFRAITRNYFTANVTTADVSKFYLTVSGVAKIRDWWNSYYTYYGPDSNASNSENNGMTTWLTYGTKDIASELNATGYKAATNYEYTNDNSLITITSVGAIQINKNNSNYYFQTQDNTQDEKETRLTTSNVYPEKSYTLYCGYIPMVMDVWGWEINGDDQYMHVATLGAAYSEKTNKWYPTGKFGDIHTVSDSLSTTVFGNDLSYKSLLNYFDGNTADVGNLFSYPNRSDRWWYYNPDFTGTIPDNSPRTIAGLALPAQGNDYYITGGKEVDVTIGYLSQPYAIGVQSPSVPQIVGATGSDYYFKKFNDADGKFDHSFFSGGLRDNVTMLDVASYHDDISGNNISLAAGYTLSYVFGDYSNATRMQNVYNTGIVYIRATGDGTENDTTGSMASGKGWTLGKETNVFHQFYGTDQYQNDSGVETALGWNTNYHRSYVNINSKDNRAPQPGYAPNVTPGDSSYGTNTHPMADTECNTIAWGTTWDSKPQAMWGTSNGTVLSWFYDYEDKPASKITSVTKEFESYMWADRIGATLPLSNYGQKKQFYDYNSVNNGNSDTYGFVSVLASINDIEFGDDCWVAVGTQSGKAPSQYCASNKCYTGSGNVGSYVNVKYCVDSSTQNPLYAWKAVKLTDAKNVNITSVTYSQGVWYAMGYVDADEDGEKDSSENGVIYYSTNPSESWSRCKTRKADGSYSSTTTYALYYNTEGKETELTLEGVNAMASQG